MVLQHDECNSCHWTIVHLKMIKMVIYVYIFRLLPVILVPWLGIGPVLPAFEVWSLNHWTKEVLKIVILRYIFFLSKNCMESQKNEDQPERTVWNEASRQWLRKVWLRKHSCPLKTGSNQDLSLWLFAERLPLWIYRMWWQWLQVESCHSEPRSGLLWPAWPSERQRMQYVLTFWPFAQLNPSPSYEPEKLSVMPIKGLGKREHGCPAEQKHVSSTPSARRSEVWKEMQAVLKGVISIYLS